MGDNGRAYTTVTPAFIDRMRQLCRRADLILPNATEAGLLLEKELPAQLDEEGARALADRLIRLFGEKRAPLALGVAPLLMGFPMFFGAGPVVMPIAGGRADVSPLICFEGTVAGLSRAAGRAGAP